MKFVTPFEHLQKKQVIQYMALQFKWEFWRYEYLVSIWSNKPNVVVQKCREVHANNTVLKNKCKGKSSLVLRDFVAIGDLNKSRWMGEKGLVFMGWMMGGKGTER